MSKKLFDESFSGGTLIITSSTEDYDYVLDYLKKNNYKLVGVIIPFDTEYYSAFQLLPEKSFKIGKVIKRKISEASWADYYNILTFDEFVAVTDKNITLEGIMDNLDKIEKKLR